MVVITLEKCPLSLRGDLTKWLQEISLGVYVGQISARVRDKLWERVCEESKSGRATMVFSARNEQRYDFRVHNTTWEPIDFDGIKLMMRPSPAHVNTLGKKRSALSDASKYRSSRRKNTQASTHEPREYVVMDIETTGLDPQADEIIELAAIKVMNGDERETFSCIVKPAKDVPQSILQLTGLSKSDLEDGEDAHSAIDRFLSFVGYCPLVAHNVSFDLAFLQAMAQQLGFDEIENETIDTLDLAKKKHPRLKSYRLGGLAEHFGIDIKELHRALPDARATRQLFLQLIG